MSNDLSRDEVVRLAREAGYRADAKMHDHDYDLFLNFYTLCRAPLVAEVERLEQWHAEMADNRNAIASERDTLKAELARVQAREPVGEVRAKCDRYGGIFVIWKKLPIAGMLLYTAPQPAAQEPFAWARPDAVDASQDFRFIKTEDFTVPLYATPTSAVPVVRKMVEALRLRRNQGLSETYNSMAEAAIAAGQKFIKENGK